MPRSKLRSSHDPGGRVPRKRKSGGRRKPPASASVALLPFQESHIRFFLAGAFASGGLMIAIDGDRRAEVPLGVNQFAVLGVLALRLLQTQAVGPRAPVGFLPTPHLKRELLRWAPAVDPHRLPKHVFRARAALESVGQKLGLLDPHAWSHAVLERTALGYRLSVPPKHVEVYIDPDQRFSTGA